ncbi:MAG: MotA/TolQ/ExbB proton channel family protein [Acidobacteriota bacterium]
MRRSYPIEPVYQLASLLLAAILVHALYVSIVRPRADAELASQRAAMQADPEYVQERSLWVVIRDYEQEACFVLGLWALAIMAFKGATALRSQRLLDLDLMPVEEGERILPEDARDHARSVEALPDADRVTLLPRVLLAGLYRFAATRDIQAVSETTRGVCDAESERLDSEMSMVRYIAWAIPSIGFIGTVRGIGDALGQAHKAVEGDIAGVTESLGVAFNSTFIALLISIVLMFLLHQLTLQQERLVLDAETYVDQHLIRHLRSAA